LTAQIVEPLLSPSLVYETQADPAAAFEKTNCY